MRVLRVTCCLVVLAWIGGCGSDNFAPRLPGPIFPPYHEAASWSRHGVIAYRDNGFVFWEGGGYTLNPSEVGIWTIDLTTETSELLVPGGDWPAWSWDGERLAFVDGGQIFTILRGGEELQQLTIGGMNLWPAWRRDGQGIAYNSNLNTEPEDNGIWTVMIGGTGRTHIAVGLMPNWNLDGSKLVHTRAEDIYIMDLRGQGVVRLTQDPALKYRPRYSPDGTRILFESHPIGTDPQILIMNADGSSPRQVTQHGGVEPDWSPEGTEVVYTRHANEPTLEDGVLWIINVENGEERQLTHKGTAQRSLRRMDPEAQSGHYTSGVRRVK